MSLASLTLPIDEFSLAFKFFPTPPEIFRGPSNKKGYRIIFHNKEAELNDYEKKKLKKLRALIEVKGKNDKEILNNIRR